MLISSGPHQIVITIKQIKFNMVPLVPAMVPKHIVLISMKNATPKRWVHSYSISTTNASPDKQMIKFSEQKTVILLSIC